MSSPSEMCSWIASVPGCRGSNGVEEERCVIEYWADENDENVVLESVCEIAGGERRRVPVLEIDR